MQMETANTDPGEANIWDWYEPLSKQNILHTSDAKNLLAIGGGGSGKSMFGLGEALYTCTQYPGAHCLLLRRDFPELEKGLILDFKSTVPKQFYKYNDQKHIATFKHNDSKIFFGHLQNASEKTLSQYLSSAFVWIFIDEMGQFSYEAYDFLRFRNRVNKECKPDIEGNMPIPRMGGGTNPLGPGYGWIKTLWVDHKPVSQLGKVTRYRDGRYYQVTNGEAKCVFDPHDHVYVHSTILDNPIQMAKDPDYIRKLERLAPALRKKALDGDLNSVAGQYFSNFTNARHVLSLPRDHELIKFENWQPVWLGMDWGLAHNSAVYWFTRAQVFRFEKWKNVVVCYRELVVNETAHGALVALAVSKMRPEEIARTKAIYLSPERFSRTTDPDPSKTIGYQMGSQFHELGLPWCTPAVNKRVDGAIFCYNLLETGDFVLIEEECPHLIRTLENVVRDPTTLEDVLKSESIEDDCYDGWRYGLVSHLNEKDKPQDIKDQERIQAIKDPTARMMLAYQIKLKKDQRAKHQKPRYNPRWMGRR
jgi:phage terminase large subunit